MNGDPFAHHVALIPCYECVGSTCREIITRLASWVINSTSLGLLNLTLPITSKQKTLLENDWERLLLGSWPACLSTWQRGSILSMIKVKSTRPFLHAVIAWLENIFYKRKVNHQRSTFLCIWEKNAIKSMQRKIIHRSGKQW